MNAASSSAKKRVSRRSKNRSARSAPTRSATVRRMRDSLPEYPVMKFSMFSQPPRHTPRSRTSVPSAVVNRFPEARSGGSGAEGM